MAYANNNLMTWVDIIGDPRNLNQRIKLDITEDTVINISRNDYVLCTTDDQTGGTAGHYYRYIAQDPITNVHTSKNDEGDANATDGHFDLSQDDTWLDLGTDGAVGGYPATWLEHGVDGAPLLMRDFVGGRFISNYPTEYGISQLPIDVGLSTDDKWKPFKLSRPATAIKGVIVIKSTGEVKRFTLNCGASGEDCVNTEYVNGGNKNYNELFINWNNFINNEDDTVIIKVYYETKSKVLSLADAVTPLTTGTPVVAGNTMFNGELLSKVCTMNWINGGNGVKRTNEHSSLIGVEAFSSGYITYGIMHTPFINLMSRVVNTGGVCKTLNYLTTSNNRARLQFVFKELKYDTDSSNWGDDNKFQITNKVSTLTDENDNTVLYGQKSFDLPYFIK